MTDTLLGKGQFGVVTLAYFKAPRKYPGWNILDKVPSKFNTLTAKAVAVKTIRLANLLISAHQHNLQANNNNNGVDATDTNNRSDQDENVVGYNELTEMLVEARLMAMLEHPHLVRLVAVCSNYLPVLLVMEYCRHGNLLQYLREHRSTFEQSRDVLSICTDMAVQIATGIEYLHSKLCIHRDLAARNVLVTDLPLAMGRPSNVLLKLADLGLTRGLHAESDYYRKRSDDAVPIKWQCPRSVTTRIYTTKSDVYSFGVLLWEIFSLGGVPFAGLTATEAFKLALAGEQLPRPRADMPQPIYLLQNKCMSREPASRPTMTTVAQLLRDMLTGLQTQSSRLAMQDGGGTTLILNPTFNNTYPDGSKIVFDEEESDSGVTEESAL